MLEQIARGHPAVLQFDPAAGAVIPAWAGLCRDREPRRIARHQDQRRSPVGQCLDGDQLGDRSVGYAVLDPVDDPLVAASRRGRRHGALAGDRAVVVHAQRGVLVRFPLGAGEVEVVVLEECREEAVALVRRHRREQPPRQRRRLGQHRGDVGVAHRQLLGDDAAGQRIGADAAEVLGQRQRAKPHLRGLPQNVQRQAAVGKVEPVGLERDRLDLVVDEAADRVAEFKLLRGQMEIVHCSTCCALGYCCTLMPAFFTTSSHLVSSVFT